MWRDFFRNFLVKLKPEEVLTFKNISIGIFTGFSAILADDMVARGHRLNGTIEGSKKIESGLKKYSDGKDKVIALYEIKEGLSILDRVSKIHSFYSGISHIYNGDGCQHLHYAIRRGIGQDDGYCGKWGNVDLDLESLKNRLRNLLKGNLPSKIIILKSNDKPPIKPDDIGNDPGIIAFQESETETTAYWINPKDNTKLSSKKLCDAQKRELQKIFDTIEEPTTLTTISDEQASRIISPSIIGRPVVLGKPEVLHSWAERRALESLEKFLAVNANKKASLAKPS